MQATPLLDFTERRLSAESADRFWLYIQAVQDPATVAGFVEQLYRQRRGRRPMHLHEDFCGTAINCVQWLRNNPEGTATGLDVDGTALQWCRDHLLAELPAETSARLTLVEADVRRSFGQAADVILALNSSFCVFKRRRELVEYLRRCRRRLNPGGFVTLEVYAGPEAQMVGFDRIKCDGFTAVWEQASFNAVSHETIAHIHFSFPDGTRLERAFTYDYRLWSPPELMEALDEVGFVRTETYCLNDEPLVTRVSGRCPCREVTVPDHWNAYVVGWG